MMPISKKLAIRMALHGCTNRPFYHLVVMLQHKGRNATPIEQLGTYDPMLNASNERLVAINYERLKFWMSKGARVSHIVEKLLGLSGFFPIHPMTYIEAQRNTKTLQRRAEELAQKDSQEETTQDNGSDDR